MKTKETLVNILIFYVIIFKRNYFIDKLFFVIEEIFHLFFKKEYLLYKKQKKNIKKEVFIYLNVKV